MPPTDAPTVAGGAHGRVRQEAAPAPATPNLPGYELLSLLGRGGMGEVWKARRAGGELVALKLMIPSDLDVLVTRFERETAMMAMLEHPGIVRLVDRGRAGATLYYAMELVEGVDLRAASRLHPLAPAAATRLVAALCEAVGHAHRLGIVHRDLKPENVLVDGAGRPRLVDFGIANLAGAAGGAALTRTGVAMGTSGYMAPEQERDSHRVDGRADIYSLGVILYELLCGDRPGMPFQAPSQRVKDLGPRFDAIVTRCIATDPAARYQRVEDLRCELHGILRELSDPADAPADATTPFALARDKDVVIVRMDAALDPAQFADAIAQLEAALAPPTARLGLGYDLRSPAALAERHVDALTQLHRTQAETLHRVGFASEIPLGRARAATMAGEISGTEAAVFASPAAMTKWLGSNRLAASARRMLAFVSRRTRRHDTHLPTMIRESIRRRGLIRGMWWVVTRMFRFRRARRALGPRDFNLVLALVSSFNGAPHCAQQGLLDAIAAHLADAGRVLPRLDHELLPLLAKSDAELVAAYELMLESAGLDTSLPARVHALKFADDVPHSDRDRQLMAIIEFFDNVTLACAAEAWILAPAKGERARRLQQHKNLALDTATVVNR